MPLSGHVGGEMFICRSHSRNHQAWRKVRWFGL